MRFTQRLGLKAAKLGLAMIVAMVATSWNSSKSEAHFFRHLLGCHGYAYHGYGYHGLGYGYAGFGYRPFGGYYSSYYGYSAPYYYAAAPVYYYRPRILPFRFCAPFVSVPVCSVSVETYADPCDPVPVYYGESSYEPSYGFATPANPISWTTSALAKSSSPMMNNLDAQRNTFAMQPKAVSLASAQKSTNLPLMMLRHPVASDVQAASAELSKPEAGTRYVASKPAVLTPYSPIWTQAATGLVDDMVANGQLEDAAASCKSMEKIEQAKGAGVYLRQGLLSYMANPNAGSVDADKALTFLDQACASGSQLQPSELAKDSLRDYLSACSTDLDQVMERLSQSILENPTKSGREMLLLTALLRMDGQLERAKLFAMEAEQMAAKSGAFRWNSLLAVCNE